MHHSFRILNNPVQYIVKHRPSAEYWRYNQLGYEPWQCDVYIVCTKSQNTFQYIYLLKYTRRKNEMNIGLNNTLPNLILVYLSSPPCDIGPHPILQLRVLGQLDHVQPRFLALRFWINSNCFLTKPHKYKSKGEDQVSKVAKPPTFISQSNFNEISHS